MKTYHKGNPFRPSTSLVLGLDLSKHCTGWALMLGTELIDYGAWFYSPKGKRVKDTPLMLALQADLSRILNDYSSDSLKIERIVYEAAQHQPGRAGEIFACMVAALKLFAHAHNIPVYLVYPQNIKKVVASDGKADKAAVVQAVNKRYSLELSDDEKGTDHNMADAIGVCYTAFQQALYLNLKEAS